MPYVMIKTFHTHKHEQFRPKILLIHDKNLFPILSTTKTVIAYEVTFPAQSFRLFIPYRSIQLGSRPKQNMRVRSQWILLMTH